MKVRQDAWTEEDDLLLAETVLRHVREGSTQLNSFEEVGDKLNRTSAACGFRWNAVVRHNYTKALSLAKKQRKQRQRMLGKEQGGKKKLLYTPPASPMGSFDVAQTGEMNLPIMEESQELETSNTGIMENPELQAEQLPLTAERPTSFSSLTLESVIAYLESMNGKLLQAEALQKENERLKLELHELKMYNEELAGKVNNLEQNTGLIQEDYETLMKIMNRARKLVLFDEEERPSTAFKMDRNGNLEKLAE
ncbi:RsfA family transcriptional regulator [Bacillus massiliglaciei]|uniref:RsfA family transcriptional regulator n=1 Tax=Bacillus massiliglaciei TaxID=1816693 RepID=UPI000AA3221C|nr:RsfA family transcriptional regulator [Bacillus massiliglaciei]